MSGPDRIWAFDYDLQDNDGTWRNWQCWSEAHPKPLNATEYIRRDPAVLAALPEVQAIVDAEVKAEREVIMPEHVIRVASMMIDCLHCLDTEAVQIANATNKSGGVDGVQVLDDAEKIINAAAGLVATELHGVTTAAIRKRGEN